MCKMLEDMRNEAAHEADRVTAEKMIRKGRMSLEEIADYVSISMDELKKIEAEIMQLA